jgi:hypothetical protein
VPCIIIILGFSALHFLPEGQGTSDLLCLFHHQPGNNHHCPVKAERNREKITQKK